MENITVNACNGKMAFATQRRDKHFTNYGMFDKYPLVCCGHGCNNDAPPISSSYNYKEVSTSLGSSTDGYLLRETIKTGVKHTQNIFGDYIRANK